MIITIIAFSILLIGIVGMHAFYVIETNKEKAKLINALIAKNPEQMRDLTLADKVAPIKPQAQAEMPDLIPEQNLDEEAFDAFIKQELEQQ